jgi:hypothetical protein
MNAPLPAERQITDDTPAASGEKTWLLVTQYKSDRIVYFTDDPGFDMPADADWCYVNEHTGALPPDMTLRNCWSWRYRGLKFIDERDAPRPNKAERLLESNKAALRKLLREKIDALRRAVAPSSLMGADLRALKLEEAHAVLAGGVEAASLRLLPAAAAARDVELAVMAQMIVDRDRRTREVIEQSERLREEVAAAIERAVDQAALAALRTRILGDLSVDDWAEQAPKPEHTTPEKMGAPLSTEELGHERFRLRIKLRNRINDLRRPLLSDYLADERLMRRKVEIAALVLQSGGAVPAGMDATLLLSHAAGRGQTVFDAAHQVTQEVAEFDALLARTERLKDLVLAQLAGVRSRGDVRAVDKLIDDIERALAPPSAPSGPAKVARAP